jgi:hypothetical protein
MEQRTEDLHQPVRFESAKKLAPDQYKAPEMSRPGWGQVREMLPGSIQGPLREAASLFLNEAVSTPDTAVSAISGESPLTDKEKKLADREAKRKRDESIKGFYRQLDGDFSTAMETTEGEGVVVEELSQPERDYAALVLRLGSVEGQERDEALREIAINQAQLVQKKERAPLTTAAQGWLRRLGLHRAAESLRPGSTRKRLQTIEAVIAQRMGYQDLRGMFEAEVAPPQSLFEQYMSNVPEEEKVKEEKVEVPMAPVLTPKVELGVPSPDELDSQLRTEAEIARVDSQTRLQTKRDGSPEEQNEVRQWALSLDTMVENLMDSDPAKVVNARKQVVEHMRLLGEQDKLDFVIGLFSSWKYRLLRETNKSSQKAMMDSARSMGGEIVAMSAGGAMTVIDALVSMIIGELQQNLGSA